jgi:hypothetical protein
MSWELGYAEAEDKESIGCFLLDVSLLVASLLWIPALYKHEFLPPPYPSPVEEEFPRAPDIFTYTL